MRTINLEKFPQQFYGSRDAFDLIGGKYFSPPGLHVAVCCSLPVVSVFDKNALPIALLIGYAISGKNSLDDGESICLPSNTSIAEWRHRLIGRFILIDFSESKVHLYLDASGTLGVVFSPTEARFASTTGLLLGPPDEKTIDPLSAVLQIPKKNNWFPFGFTTRRDAKRLIPHHYLDLRSFTPQRFRRLDSLALANIRQSAGACHIIGQIRDSLENCINAITSKHPTALALTAGRDSRMLVAASSVCTVKPIIYTSEIPHRVAYRDVIVAERIARQMNLEYVSLKSIITSQELLDAWQDRVGHCVAGPIWKESGSGRQFYANRIILAGLCGEVGRSFYWRRDDFLRKFDDSSHFLQRIRLPHHAHLEDAACKWLKQFEGQDWLDVLDWAYIELRLGCWAGPSLYGNIDCKFTLSPYNSEYILDLMQQLPQEFRFDQKLFEKFISSYPRCFSDAPINKAPVRDEISFMLRKPATAWRMRRRMGLENFLWIGKGISRRFRRIGRVHRVKQP